MTTTTEPEGGMTITTQARRGQWADRVDAADWAHLTGQLNADGCALTPQLLAPGETDQLAALYDCDERFRATVDMGRHRFGQGEYRYFRRPFPEPVEHLRQALYRRLLPVARDWHGKLGLPAPWPGTDHTGGEFLLVEQRPRAQSRGTAIVIPHGHGLIFTTRARPVRSQRGWSAGSVRHGVSAIRSGQRLTLGLVLHDAA